MNNCKCEFKHFLYLVCFGFAGTRAACFLFYNYSGDWVFESRRYPHKTLRDVQRAHRFATMIKKTSQYDICERLLLLIPESKGTGINKKADKNSNVYL